METPKRGVRKPDSDVIRDAYFKWMVRLVDGERQGRRYLPLLRLLHETDFFYTMEMDENCAGHGVELRYRFGYEQKIPRDEIGNAFAGKACSVLEMMAALALRCEEHITTDPDFGDRTGQWFFEMLDSLGLSRMDDKHFDRDVAEDVLFRFMSREYFPNGEGGLFTVPNVRQDLRDVDIWSQMMRYLNSTLYSERRGRHV